MTGQPGPRSTDPGIQPEPEAAPIEQQGPSKRHAPMMLTTDIALKVDQVYGPVARRFHENPDQLAEAFAEGWHTLGRARHGEDLAGSRRLARELPPGQHPAAPEGRVRVRAPGRRGITKQDGGYRVIRRPLGLGPVPGRGSLCRAWRTPCEGWYSPVRGLARFRSPLLAAPPFAVHQVGGGEMDRDAAEPETVNRLRYRVSAAGPSLSSARDPAWMPSAHSDPAAPVHSPSCRRAADASSLAPLREPRVQPARVAQSPITDQPIRPSDLRRPASQACSAERAAPRPTHAEALIAPRFGSRPPAS